RELAPAFFEETEGRARRRPQPDEGQEEGRAMTPPDNCPDCGVPVGRRHRDGCDWEDCPYCGLQLLGCDHAGAVPLDDRIAWDGMRPVEQAAAELGWYAVLVPGKGCVPCPPDTPGCIPDLNRVLASCRWDGERKRFGPEA